jgi:hypothetical protein
VTRAASAATAAGSLRPCSGGRPSLMEPVGARDRNACVRLFVAVLVLSFVACACTSSGGSARNEADSSPPAAPATSSVVDESGYVRTCASRVIGDIGAPSAWRSSSITIGRSVLLDGIRGASHAPRVAFGGRHGRYPAGKVLVVVKQGERVTMRVPTSETRVFSLLYDPGSMKANNRYAISQGEHAVTFVACPGTSSSWSRATQFNGGPIVAGARCVSLDVSVGDGPWRTIRVAFGRGACKA